MIVLKESKVEKFLKNVRKTRDELDFFLISSELSTDGTFKTLESLPDLVPEYNIMLEYIDGSDKKARKKYIDYITSNEEVYVQVISMLMSISLDRIPIIIVSDVEYELGYINDLIEFISDKYKVDYYNYKNAKKFISNNKLKIDVSLGDTESFKKDLKSHKHLLEPQNMVDILNNMSKKELRKYIEKKYNMNKKKFKKEFGTDPKKKKLIKFILKS